MRLLLTRNEWRHCHFTTAIRSTECSSRKHLVNHSRSSHSIANLLLTEWRLSMPNRTKWLTNDLCGACTSTIADH